MIFPKAVGVIGGCGHVGLPLALTFADAGLTTAIYDVGSAAVASVRAGVMPFQERGAEELLARVLATGMLTVHDRPEVVAECESLVLVIGTPVDEHLNPNFGEILSAIEDCLPHLRDGQLLVLRSTLFPGVTDRVQRFFDERSLDIPVAFCPERVAEGHGLREFRELPQIVSATRPEAMARVRKLFGGFVPEFIELTPMEAEVAKLMTNAWRYVQFATVNQFYMIAGQHGLAFDRILDACRHHYPRMVGMPGPGFAAGPCLRKDTMQLAAFGHHNFVLGHAAMLVNEGLPAYVVEAAKQEVDLAKATVGILGMAFKAESDDPRDSLSYKLRKLLRLEARQVLCSDPYVRDPSFVGVDRILDECAVIFIGAPHRVYHDLEIPPATRLVDVWGCVKSRQS